MENEQKFTIPLDSPLDINSNDMLVQASKPTFAFNRQRFLGSLLQTSVRYEDEGWFAGWWGHNFDLISTGNNTIVPSIGPVDKQQISSRIGQFEQRYFVFKQLDKGISFAFNTAAITQWLAGAGTITRAGDNPLHIAGVTTQGDTFECDIDVYTGVLFNWTSTNADLIYRAEKDVDMYKLWVGLDIDPTQNFIWLRRNDQVDVLGAVLQYRRDAVNSYWDDTFVMDDATLTPRSLKPEITIRNIVRESVGTSVERVFADIVFKAPIIVKAETMFNERDVLTRIPSVNIGNMNWVMNVHYDVTPPQGQDQISNDLDLAVAGIAEVNKQGVGELAIDSRTTFKETAWADYWHWICIWLQFGSEWEYTVLDYEWSDINDDGTKDGRGVEVHINRIGDAIASLHNVMNDNTLIKSYWTIHTVADGVEREDKSFVSRQPLVYPLVPNDDDPPELEPEEVPEIEPTDVPQHIPNPVAQEQIPNPWTRPANVLPADWPATIADPEWTPELDVIIKKTAADSTGHGTIEQEGEVDIYCKNRNPNYPINMYADYFSDMFGFTLSYDYEYEYWFYPDTVIPQTTAGVELSVPTGSYINGQWVYDGGTADFAIPKQNQTPYTTFTHGVDPAAIDQNVIGPWDRYNVTNFTFDESYNLHRRVFSTRNKYGNETVANPMHKWLAEQGLVTLNADAKTFKINIPICTEGYTIGRISVDQVAPNKVFSYKTVPNSLYGLKLWRIDDGGGEGIGDWAIDATRMVIKDTGDFLYVIIDADGNNPCVFFYQEHNQDACYPKWIGGNEDNMTEFAPSLDPGKTMAKVYVNYRQYTMLDSISSFRIECEDPSEQAQQVMTGIMDNWRSTITRASTYIQHVVIMTDANNRIEFDHDIRVPYTAQNVTVTFDGITHIYKTFELTKERVTLQYDYNDIYRLTFIRTFIISTLGIPAAATIVEQNVNGSVLFSNGFGAYSWREQRPIDTGGSTIIERVESVDTESIKLLYNINNKAEVWYTPLGIFSKDPRTLTYIRSNGNSIVFEYDGVTYTLTVDPNSRQMLKFTATDIRDGSVRSVYDYNLDTCYMYLKQFWSTTVDIENFWWIDSNHVMCLTKHYMELHRKRGDGSVHDWMGDNWDLIKQVPRTNFKDKDTIFFNVSMAKDAMAVVFKLEATETSFTLKYIEDIVNANWNAPVWQTHVVNRSVQTLGTALNRAANVISSYININVAATIASSKISATKVGNVFMVGIAANKGLQQWTYVRSGNWRQILGYGHVGLNGCLTGGQIPTQCCDAQGFKEVVRDLQDLPEEYSGNNIEQYPNACFGTKTCVWFVYQQVPSIVSHMLFNGSSHTLVNLQLNNNVTSLYESTSFNVAALMQQIPDLVGVRNIFDMMDGNGVMGAFKTGLQVLSSVAIPPLLVFKPAYANIIYINHTAANYAYVWRNGVQETFDFNKMSDMDKAFGKHKFEITYANPYFGNMNIWLAIILKGITYVDQAIGDLTVNKPQGQQAPEDFGAKYSQYATDLAVSTMGTMIKSFGETQSVSSTVMSQLALDMFYHVSDKAECWAGPGFVNHRLTAQAPMQSVVDTQVIGLRTQYFACLLKLSQMLLHGVMYLLENAIELINRTNSDWTIEVDAESNTEAYADGTGAGVGVGTSLDIPTGAIANVAMQAIAQISRLLLSLYKITDEFVMPAIANMLGGETGIATQNGGIVKYVTQIEAKHYHGDKPMSFMWPAVGVNTPISYTNEFIRGRVEVENQRVNLGITSWCPVKPIVVRRDPSRDRNRYNQEFYEPGDANDILNGNLVNVSWKSYGGTTQVQAPADMAVVEGITSTLPTEPSKNQQIAMPPAAFPPPPFFDYVIDKRWKLYGTTTNGSNLWISQDDTKLFDGDPSNIVVTNSFCGVASPYIAIEVKNEFDRRYMRPYAITPTAIALNINRINCVQNTRAYHAFDGVGNRVVHWVGGAGAAKNTTYFQYMFQINDHFKRGNKLYPSEFSGSFEGPPSLGIDNSLEQIANLVENRVAKDGYVGSGGVPGEDKDQVRLSIPVHSENLGTLPAMVRMLQPYRLSVVTGITCLVTDNRNLMAMYKAPSSIDFTIDTAEYRAMEEYLCSIQHDDKRRGLVMTTPVCATAGLHFIGATTKQAFFYSPATRMYYAFNAGGKEITKKDIVNRFKDITHGRWDFVNQEVMIKMLMTNPKVQVGWDDVIIGRLDDSWRGEVYPPNETVYRKPIPDGNGSFLLLSMPGGTVYQGPKRFIVNRFVINEHMYNDIIRNKRKWTKVSRDIWQPDRDYHWRYNSFDTDAAPAAVKGWTHNPFRLATSMLGLDEETDCKFEWELTFAWTEQLEQLYEQNEYVTVNVAGETVTPGGTLLSDPTHIFLFKECFTRAGDAGYYTFKFQSNNGIGNRERLYVWGDGLIALEDLTLYTKDLTKHRTSVLNTQVDVQSLTEQ